MALERLISSTAGLATPALVVDLAAADRNIAAADVRLRPHFKAHKCPELMRRQLAGGDCTGVTCATAWEAEVAARAGLHDDILVANEVADPGGLASLRRAAEHARITVAIDSPRHLELLRRDRLRGADRDQRRPGPLRAGPGRRGRDRRAGRAGPGTPADVPRPAGLRGPRRAAARAPVARGAGRARRGDPRTACARVLDCELVSGGGTGTYDLSTHLDEIQAGSYVLLDASYDELDLPFELALACRTTIVSRNGTRAVCDAGLKALSAEYGLPRAVDPAIEVIGLADEHSTLQLAPGERAAGGRRGPADPRPHRPDGQPPRRPARRRGRRHRPPLAGRG